MTVGDKLHAVRESLVPKVSQRELARRLGAPQSTVSRWESNEIMVPSNSLVLIAQALGIHPTELLPLEESGQESYAQMAEDMLTKLVGSLPTREQGLLDALIATRSKQIDNGRQEPKL